MPSLAERLAFRAVPETCPTVERALNELMRRVLDEFRDATTDELPDDSETCKALERAAEKFARWIESHRDDAEKAIKEQTTALRAALVEAIEARLEAEADDA
jgi:hypothetical protein